jgi:hypothetical protein
MKRNIARTFFLAALLLSLVSVATAQNDGNCTAAALAGPRGHTGTGTLILPAGPVPFAFVGRTTFDAAGNFSGTQTSSLAGQVSQETISGTGTVSSDCTTVFSVNILDESGNVIRTANWTGVYVNKGRELRAIMTSLVVNGMSVPAVMTMNARKLRP